MIRLTLLLLLCSISGCASVDELPDRSSEIDFSETIDEWTDKRTYVKSYRFKNTDRELVYRAAKAALVHEDYEVTTGSLEDGAVLGIQGTTMMHWNLVSGVYFNELATDTQIRIVVKSNGDIRLSTDSSLDDEARKLLDAMRLFIDAEIAAEPDSTSE